jgi:hypothetical protein
MLKQAEVNDTLEGVQICPTALRVNHLFFTDDSLIIMKATTANANCLKEILALYRVR